MPVIQNPPANVDSIPGSGRSSGGGHGNPLQYSCLENLRDRGAWWATVRRVAKSWTRLKQLNTHTHTHTHTQPSARGLWATENTQIWAGVPI